MHVSPVRRFSRAAVLVAAAVLAAGVCPSRRLAAQTPANRAVHRTAAGSRELYDSLANVIVTKSLRIQRGEEVFISTPPRLVGLLEALDLAVAKAGGWPVSVLSAERTTAYQLREMPLSQAAWLAQPSRIMRGVLTAADAAIIVTGYETDMGKLFSSLSPERQAVFQARAGWDSLTAQGHSRNFVMSVPGPGDTAGSGRTVDQLRDQIFRAASADPDEMAAVAAGLVQRIAHARVLTVTTRSGTSFRFGVRSGAPVIDVGRLTKEDAERLKPAARNTGFPAGIVKFLISPESVNGAIRGLDAPCVADSVTTRLTLELAAGLPQHIDAATGRGCIQRWLAPAGEATSFTIGLNDRRGGYAIHGVEFSTPTRSGIVSIGFGNDLDTGGTNASERSWTLSIPGATLSADGTVLIKDGVIVDRGAP